MAVVIALTMTGCFAGPGPHEYDLVDKAASQLKITQVGDVLYEHHYGKMQRMSGPGPSVEYFIATDDPDARQSIIDTAVQNGWDGSGDLGASINQDGHYLQLAIAPLRVGETAQLGDGTTRTWNRSGLLVNIDQS